MQLAASTRAAVRPALRTRSVAAVAPRPAARSIRARSQSSGNQGFDSDELQAKVNELGTQLKNKWDKTDDKAGAVVVIGGTVVALSLAFSLVNAIDKIPIVSDLIELVGIGVTGWFTYRYLTVGPDRDELFITLRKWYDKIYGQF